MKRSRYYSENDLRIIAADLTSAETIPVNIEIEAEHRILDLSEVEKILNHSESIYIQDCGCRSQFHNCDAPLDTCIAVNVNADYAEKWSDTNPRKIGVDEALKILRKSHEAGLVHMAYIFKGEEEPQLICSCCKCCCHTLGGIVDHGITTQVLTSKLIAENNEVKCIDCGKCIERCPLGARKQVGGKMVYDASKCFGCGLCLTTCPMNAIKLIDRKRL